ncbi:MAG: PBP1A family penicillin-binding protein [Bacillota bacterium]
MSQHSKKRKLKVSRIILLCVIFFFIIGLGSALGLVLGAIKDLPDWKSTGLITENTSFIYDSKGNLILKLHKTENRTSVDLKDMPSYLIDAFIATEDVRFRQHHGIDIKRILGAMITDLKNRNFSEGASTITMQLVRNAILENQEKKMERKIKEAILAIQVERNYTKDEILYFYLNEIYFGHGANGVQAAAQTYFGKNVGQLTLGEAAMLTGIVRNPRMYSPFLNPENSLRIRNIVLDNMVRNGNITQVQANEAKNETLKLADYEKNNQYPYPWFTDYTIDQAEELLRENGFESSYLYTGGLRIYTTLDPEIQKIAEKAYNNSALFPKSTSADPVQSAMVVMDPKTGEVKALIGGREHITRRGLNRATDIRRQPGSVIKPIAVYGPALEKGYTPSSIIEDTPVSFGSYSPVNQDGRYRGLITMREAVRWSVNIPAVKLLNQIGIDQGFSFAKKLGLPLDDKNDKNLSLALGGLTRGVSPLNIAAAYSAFDNQGVFIEPHVITKITDQKGNVIVDFSPKKIITMSEKTAYQITDILKTVVDSGTGTRARLNRPVAGKTGTTQLPNKTAFINKKGNKDAWFAGYTPELVGVVWMGYDNDYDKNGNPQYLSQVYGGQYPAQLWKEVIGESLKNTPVTYFKYPTGLAQKKNNKSEKPSDNSTEQKKNQETQPIVICVDPRHGGTPVLANIQKPGTSGGCPQEYIVYKTFEHGAAPTGQCNLSDHQIISENKIEDENESGETAQNPGKKLRSPSNYRYYIQANKVHITWNNNNEGAVYKIERWPADNPGNIVTFQTSGNSYTDSSTQPGIPYYYRIYAVNPNTMETSNPSSTFKVTTR